MKKMLWVCVVLAAVILSGCFATSGDIRSTRTYVEERLKSKADKADVAALEWRTKALSEGISAIDAKANDAVEGIGALKKRADRTDATVAELAKNQVAITANVEGLGRQISAVSSKIAAIEAQVVGVRRIATGTLTRVGTLEDSQGYDHGKRVFHLTGFQAATYDAEKNEIGESCWKISAAMKKRLDEIAALQKNGWAVDSIAGFADGRPFMKNGKPIGGSDALNAKCAEFRAEAVAEALEVDPANAIGRGVTTKFGGRDMNRSVLIYLERVATPPAAPAAGSPPASPAAPTT